MYELTVKSHFDAAHDRPEPPLDKAPELNGVTWPPTEIDNAVRCGSNSSARDTSLLTDWLSTRFWPPAIESAAIVQILLDREMRKQQSILKHVTNAPLVRWNVDAQF